MLDLVIALGAIPATLEAIKLAVAARDDAKVDAAISGLKDRLYDLQTANIEAVQQLHTAQARNHALVQELEQLKTKHSERALYVLHDLSDGQGRLYAYRYEPANLAVQGHTAPFHYLCQPCFDIDRKSVLVYGVGDDRRAHWSCSVCRNNVAL